jgi:hypothetical protein
MSTRRRCAGCLLAVLAALATTHGASAADPSIADCLHANAAAAHLRNTHKLRAAREQLLVCASQSCPADIRAECARRVVDVNTSLPTVVFEVSDPSGTDLTAVSVSMDGKPLVDQLDGTAIALDPGPHAFRFEAPGQPPVDKAFVIFEGQKDRRERVAIGPIPAPPPAPTPETPSSQLASPPSDAATDDPVPSTAPAPPSESTTPAWLANGTLTTAGMVTSGVGLLGLTLGTVFGIEALTKKSDAGCDANSVCPNAAAANTLRGSRSAGNLSTGFFTAGALVGAAGATMWIVGRSHEVQASAQIAPGGAAVRLTASWP